MIDRRSGTFTQCDAMKSDLTQTCQTWRNTMFVVSVSFLPLFVFWICVYVVWPWRYYDCFDPEGIHFAGGLSILHGHGPGNVDNPATPLQTLSALLCWGSGCGILDMEQFRGIAYAAVIVLRIAAACVLVRFVLRDLPLPLQITLLWLPWLAPDFSMMSRQWCPETMYFPMGVLAVVAIYHSLNDSSRWQCAFLAGLAIGAMIGVKFIFVAWAAAAFLTVVLTHRPAIAARVCLALGAGHVTGFVLATLPAITRYPRMFEWLLGLATKTGQYGSGSSGFVNLELAGANLVEILVHQKIWTSLVISTSIALLIRKPRTRISIFCVFALLGSYALVLKQFAPRYLAPTGLILLLAVAELLRGLRFRSINWSGSCAAIVVGLLLGKSLAFDTFVHRVFVTDRQESEKALNEFLAQKGRTSKSVILYGWRAFVPSFTVRFMSRSESPLFDAEVDAAFPHEGLFKSWPDELLYPPGMSDWDFIVVGEDYGTLIDAEGLKALRQKHQSWIVTRYIVIKNTSSPELSIQNEAQSP